MAANDHLFDAFPATTKEQWIQQVIKDLKGGDFNTILNYTSRDGIVIHPFYTEEDLAKYSERKPLFSHTDWEVGEELAVEDEAAANKKALQALESGATSLVFRVQSAVSLEVLLQEIGIEYIQLQFILQEGIGEFDTQLSSYLSAKKLDRSALNLIVSYDPIHQLVETGSWLEAAEQAAFIKHINSAKGARNCCINGAIYHNAGASPAYEIACIAAHANEYFQWMEKPGVPVQVQVAVGPDYFFEIAKLRALRKVMTLLAAAYETEMDICFHAETATRNLTLYDTHNNLLRTTTEAMAATIGGCNSLVVKPFDCFYNAPNEFSSRLARNIQLLLKTESYFDKVSDVAAGSFFIEELTEQLAEKAWSLFQDIEANGGFIASLQNGTIQQTIEESAALQQERFTEGKEVLVGTNKFPDMAQHMADKATGLAPEANLATTMIKPLSAQRLSRRAERERLQTETPQS